MMNFSEIILALRKKSKLSQRIVSDKLGISQALLSHYERGIREPRIGFVSTIADFYGVTCDYLLGVEKDTAPEIQRCSNRVITVLNNTKRLYGTDALNAACAYVETLATRISSVLTNPNTPYDPELTVAVASAEAGFISTIRQNTDD